MNSSTNDPIPVQALTKKDHPHLWRFTLAFIVSITITLILTIASQLKFQSQKDLKKQLSNILTITQGSIRNWKENVQLEHQAISHQPVINKLIRETIRNPDNFAKFHKVLNPWIKIHNYSGFGIVFKDKKGKTHLLSDKPFLNSEKLIDRAFTKTFILESPLTLVTTTPVEDQSGKMIASLVILIDASSTFSKVTRIARLGESGETYVLNSTGRMITQSRFEGNGHQLEVREPGGNFTMMAIDLMNGKSGSDLEGYRDYRGKEVVGAWIWDKELGLGLGTEINKEEAYSSYEIVRYMIWISIFILITGMTAILIFRETRAKNIARIKSLQETDRTRKELLSVVSHDLKNPLSTLLMTNEILLRTLPEDQEFSGKRKKLLEKSHRAANQMRQLITDLLDASKIEAGKLIIHPVKCDSLTIVNQTIDLLESIASEKGVILSHNLENNLPPIWADPERIAQIFSNLAGNSIKFTPESGCILISARVTDQMMKFSITDTGIGIGKEELPLLFDRYWQAKKTQQFGTGLGLTICKQLVLAHGGEIWAESEIGTGTTFNFTLPLYKDEKLPTIGEK